MTDFEDPCRVRRSAFLLDLESCAALSWLDCHLDWLDIDSRLHVRSSKFDAEKGCFQAERKEDLEAGYCRNPVADHVLVDMPLIRLLLEDPPHAKGPLREVSAVSKMIQYLRQRVRPGR